MAGTEFQCQQQWLREVLEDHLQRQHRQLCQVLDEWLERLSARGLAPAAPAGPLHARAWLADDVSIWKQAECPSAAAPVMAVAPVTRPRAVPAMAPALPGQADPPVLPLEEDATTEAEPELSRSATWRSRSNGSRIEFPENKFQEAIAATGAHQDQRRKPAMHGKTLFAMIANANFGVDPSDFSSRAKMRKWMNRWFDTIMCAVIIANTVVIFTQLQWEGDQAAAALGVGRGDGWRGAKTAFLVFEHLFNATFVVELFVRLAVYRCEYFCDWTNIFDVFIVVSGSLDLYVLTPLSMGEGRGDLLFARTVRLSRLVKTARFIRFIKFCAPLRVLVCTITASCMSLFWSMLVLIILMVMNSMFLSQCLTPFIEDSSADYNIRLWVNRLYGGSVPAFWTTFEITMSGCWPNHVRTLVEEVSVWYGVYFGIYVSGVIFAIIRIITALFLKETLNASQNDAEMIVHQKLEEREAYAQRLKEVFLEADTSGDGGISYAEFEALLSDPLVKSYLSVLELDAHEAQSLFKQLDDGDGVISLQEFLSNAMRLKGTARSQDVIAILHDSQKILAQSYTTVQMLDKLAAEVLPASSYARVRKAKSTSRP